MQSTASIIQKRRTYWRYNRGLTLLCLLLWFSVTYLAAFFADSMNSVVIFGFPLGFYMAAQGSLLVYLMLVGGYVLAMRYLERGFSEPAVSGDVRMTVQGAAQAPIVKGREGSQESVGKEDAVAKEDIVA